MSPWSKHAELRCGIFRCGEYPPVPLPIVGAVYAEVAARYGVTTTADAVQAAFGGAWAEAQAVTDPVRYGVGEPDGRRFWHALVHATFAQIALPDDFEGFFDELYWLFSKPTVWRLYPECLTVLQTLRQQGYVVGVISNWDLRLLDLLHGLGLMDWCSTSASPRWSAGRNRTATYSPMPSTPSARPRRGRCTWGTACTPTCRRPAGRHEAAVAAAGWGGAPRRCA